MPPVTAGKAQEASCLGTTALSTSGPAGESAQAASSSSSPCPELMPTSASLTVSTSPATAEQAEEAASLAEDATRTEPAGRSVMPLTATQISTVAAHFTVMCSTMARQQNADLHIHGVEPSGESGGASESSRKPQAEAAEPAPEFKHSVKMDRAMEVWAQAELGLIRVRGLTLSWG